jgi:Ca2+-transporting ATPase
MSLLPVVFNWPLVLLPVHIVFLELIIDPACSVVFEAEKEEAHVMKRPPRSLREPLFSRRMVTFSLLQGFSVLTVVLVVFLIAMYRGQGEAEARALSFTTLIVANLGLILTNRSWRSSIITSLKSPNAALGWVIGGAIVFLSMVLYLPFLRDLFRLSTLHLDDLLICLVAGFISFLWFEAFKVYNNS